MLADEKPLTVSEVAEHFKKSAYTIREYAKTRHFPAHKIGGEWRFYLSEINAELTSRVVDPWALPSKRNRAA